MLWANHRSQRVWSSSLRGSPWGQKVLPDESLVRLGFIKLLLPSTILVDLLTEVTECSAPRPGHWKLCSPLGSYQVLMLSAVTSCRSSSAKQTSAFCFGVQCILFIKCKMGLRSKVRQSTVSAWCFTVLVSASPRSSNIIAREAWRAKSAPGGRVWGQCCQTSSVRASQQRLHLCGW